MRKLIYAALISAVLLSLGCAVTDYPVIFDTAGPWENAVLDGQYDQAYIIPSGQVATIWDDGSDELFTLVAQDWKGDQWLYTYNNFDPSGAVTFLDQTYCDPNHGDDCFITKAWNPDYPNAYPWNGQDSSNEADDPFDYVADPDCNGYRSLSLLLSMGSRIGECGSGIMADQQNLFFEYSLLEETTFRGRDVYALPFDSTIASFTVTGEDDFVSAMPIYGSYMTYLDHDLRLAVPVTPNMEYQLDWLRSFTANHGNALRVNVNYGSLNVDYQVRMELN
jgi:hypothetical protein